METDIKVKPKTVVVMADTHARTLAELPPELIEASQNADFVIHLGDFSSGDVLCDLKKMRNFCGVVGNHDDSPVKNELKRTIEIEIEGKKLGLIHGLFFPFRSRTRMKSWFKKRDDNIQVILYGHSHLPVNHTKKGVLYFNPGSVMGKFPAPTRSFGVLTIDGTIKSKIVRLDHYPPLHGPLMRLVSIMMRGIIRMAEAWP